MIALIPGLALLPLRIHIEKSEIVAIAQEVIADLETAEVETLVGIMEQRHAKAGTILLSQGDTGSHLLLLLNGDFSVFIRPESISRPLR